MLSTLCEAELWNEAREELMRLREHGLVTDSQQHVWKASILLGERQDQEVIEMAERLGAAARRTIEERFSPAAIGARYRRRLESIAAW